MNLISADSISKTFGDKTLFSNISFGISQGEKAALIGVNGTGKSTLLKIIAGKETSDTGKVSVNNDCVIAYLPQNPSYDENDSISDHIFKADTPRQRLIRRYDEACRNNPDNLDEITEEMTAQGAWQYEQEVKNILGELGIYDLSLKMRNLSGGMIRKCALAQALLNDASLIILDEPTNHLDADTTAILEDRLKSTTKAVLMVTHDRYFLDNITDKIIELENGGLRTYDGGYAYYLEKKAEHEHNERKEQERTANILKGELKWLMKRPKHRGTKQKARVDRAHEMIESTKTSKTAELSDFEVSGRRLGGVILEVKDVSFSYGSLKIADNLSHTFVKGERLGIAGANGAGKTTLLKLFTGELPSDSGEVIRGVNTVFGVFSQDSSVIDSSLRIIDSVKEIAENILMKDGSYISAGDFLEKFLFPKEMHYREVHTLSGGELRRLHLIRVLMSNPNFLILDEPTNDLDIKTLGVLEDFLCDFSGCACIVSHDRYFLDRTATSLLVLNGNADITTFPGLFTEWLAQKRRQKQEAKKQTASKPRIKERGPKLTYKEKEELKELPTMIEALESELADIENELAEGGTDYERLSRLNARQAEAEDELLEKMQRLEDLESVEG